MITTAPAPRLSRQSGISLLITLIALSLLSLAGAAMMRAQDFGGIVVGNISFRQSSVHASDAGIEHARTWLLTQSTAMQASGGLNTVLHNNATVAAVGSPTGPYFASWGDFDPKSYTWTDPTQAYQMSAADLPANLAGHTVYWVIHRMCRATGAPTAANTNCLKVTASSTQGDSKKVVQYGDYNKSGSSETPYYRITSRVNGPRSTVTYVQAIVF
jgi:type IV pilus assembly protein PilX